MNSTQGASILEKFHPKEMNLLLEPETSQEVFFNSDKNIVGIQVLKIKFGKSNNQISNYKPPELLNLLDNDNILIHERIDTESEKKSRNNLSQSIKLHKTNPGILFFTITTNYTNNTNQRQKGDQLIQWKVYYYNKSSLLNIIIIIITRKMATT